MALRVKVRQLLNIRILLGRCAAMTISRTSYPGPSYPPAEYAWFHVVLTVYGAWLPGDPRGFRTHHHREHVEGDYKSPPTKSYAARHRRSQLLLTQPPVQLESCWRPIVGEALVHRLGELGGFVLGAAVAGQHMHVVVKLPKQETRNWVGVAKRHAWFEMREQGWQKKLWAKRGKFTPIEDRRHLRNALRYVVRHERQDAWVWVWEGLSEGLLQRLRNE